MNFGLESFAARPFASQIVPSPHRSTLSKKAPAATVFAIVAIAALCLLSATAAQAQGRSPRRETNANRKARIAREIAETYGHRWEVAGGGGYIRFSSGQSLQKNSEIAFWTDTTYFLNPKLGITGELRGGFGNAKIGNNSYGVEFKPQISEYPFMAGPTYRFWRQEKYVLSGFALGGAAIGKFDGDTKGVPGPDLGFWPSNVRPAFSIGMNLDLNLYPNLAFRIAPSYLATTFGGTVENNAGFEMGLVYRFGHQKK